MPGESWRRIWLQRTWRAQKSRTLRRALTDHRGPLWHGATLGERGDDPRAWVGSVLALSGRPEAIALLQALGAHPVAEVRLGAARGLASLYSASGADRAAIRRALDEIRTRAPDPRTVALCGTMGA